MRRERIAPIIVVNRTTATSDAVGADMQSNYSDETLLRPAEVAALANVDRKTVARWAESGRLPSFRTLGGHRRFRLHEVLAALENASREQ